MPSKASVRIGRTESGGDFYLDFGSAWHTAIQGQTRSGKSVLSYVALSQLAQMQHVVVTGCDPTGILLNPFRDYPHPEWRALGAGNMAEHRDVLQRLIEEMDRRINILLERRQDKIEDFTPDMPLIVCVLEEFPGIMGAAKGADAASGAKAGDRIEPAISVAVGRLVREAAKVGIRVILLAQRMSSQAVDTDSRSQFGCRISMRLDNADAVKMLHDSVDETLMAQFPRFAPGIGLYELPGVRERFRADVIDYNTYFDRVARSQPLHGVPTGL